MKRGLSWSAAAWGLSGLAFLTFLHYRTRYVGGCDNASYYMDSLRWRGVPAGLPIDRSLPVRGPLAPLCMVLRADGELNSFFPPGFPILLAAAGALGAPFATMPVLGAASGVALFYAARALGASAFAALATAAFWLCSPIVFFGSTQVMSDMPAAAFAIFALLAAATARPALAGQLLGVSCLIRPTQVLLVPGLLLFQSPVHRRTLARYVAGLAAAAGVWLCVTRFSYGGFTPPYTSNLSELTGSAFSTQLRFLLRETLVQQVPVVVLAVVGVWHSSRRLAVVAWYCPLLLLYSLWRTPFDAWWWLRYLLPALPAVFLAAAAGLDVLWKRARVSRPALFGAGVGAAIAAYAFWVFLASAARDSFITDFNVEYKRAARYVAARLPRKSLIGAITYSAPLRLYGRLQSFLWLHPQADQLVQSAQSKNRPLFLLLTDKEARERSDVMFDLTPIDRLGSGVTLFRIEPPGERIDVGSPGGRQYLGEGWSGDERAGEMTFAWAMGHRAVLNLFSASPFQRIRLGIFPFSDTAARQTLCIKEDAAVVGTFALHAGPNVIHVTLSSARPRHSLELEFGAAIAPASLGNSSDPRPLAAGLDWIEMR